MNINHKGIHSNKSITPNRKNMDKLQRMEMYNDRNLIVDIKELKKSYSDVGDILSILRGINLSVGYNQSIAITGESGSGKSTLLHLLGLLDRPDDGQIFYFGQERSFDDKNVFSFRNRNIGFVFQYHYLLEDLTACENIAMPSFIKTGNWKKSIHLAQELLRKIDMIDRQEHYPNQLSGGEQQRVAIARALINNPKMVLADEPTGNLDQKHSEEVIDLIIQLNKQHNCSLIIVTHNKDIAELMQRHYILDNGYLEKTK